MTAPRTRAADRLRPVLRRVARDETGATATEYALLVGVIVVVVAAGVFAFGTALAATLQTFTGALAAALPG